MFLKGKMLLSWGSKQLSWKWVEQKIQNVYCYEPNVMKPLIYMITLLFWLLFSENWLLHLENSLKDWSNHSSTICHYTAVKTLQIMKKILAIRAFSPIPWNVLHFPSSSDSLGSSSLIVFTRSEFSREKCKLWRAIEQFVFDLVKREEALGTRLRFSILHLMFCKLIIYSWLVKNENSFFKISL